MNTINSSFSNGTTPLPCMKPSKEPLNFGITVFAPISSEPGSSTLFFLQPLLVGKVFASVGVLIVTQLFLFIADRFTGHELTPIQKLPILSPEQTVRMSLSDLQIFLASLSQAKLQSSSGTSNPSGTVDIGAPSPESSEIPIVVALAVWGDFTNKLYSPSVFFLFPVLTFPGLRGAIPLLVLELLTTIFVRSVVPPETTGSIPLTNSVTNKTSQLLQFSPEEILNLLNKFSKHF